MEVLARQVKSVPLKKTQRISKSDSIQQSLGKLSKTSCESTLSRVFQTDLATYCPKKIFYIFFVSEHDDKSIVLLDDLKEVNNNYEELSSLTFISRDDVLALLDTTPNYIFPNQLKPLLLNVIENIKGQGSTSISLILHAQLLKLKIIQVMYQQYANQVKRNERERNLENLLGTLSKECKRKYKKEESPKDIDEDKDKGSVKDETKNAKKIKKDDKTKDFNKDEDIDYTEIPLDNDGITYDENIFDYIWFYCIKGYYNPGFIHILIDQVNVPVSGIIKVSASEGNEANQSDELKSYWNLIKQYFLQSTEPYKLLENTILMQFTPSQPYPDSSSLVVLEEFIFVLRKIVNIKLTYLKYLRHLRTNRIQHSYAITSLECLQQYNKCLRYIPLECTSTELILDALLKEVCFNYESIDTPSLKSLFMAKPKKSVHCVDPLYDFDAFAITSKQNPSSTNSSYTDISGFLVHENDELTKLLKSYKYVGVKIAEITLNVTQHLPVFCGLENASHVTTEDITHLHDVNPDKDVNLIDAYVLDNFMYIFLFNSLCSKIQRPEPAWHYNLCTNLPTFNIQQFWNENQPKFDGEVIDSDENLYNTSIVKIQWKNSISRNLLIQEVCAALQEFSYVDRKYSPETDNFLFVFSDKLDQFGVNTKIIDVVIRTPICIRDFCRYTTVSDSSWLKENKTEIDENTFKIVFQACPGAQKIKTQMNNMFHEYSYLLDGDIKEEIDEHDLSCHQDVAFEGHFENKNGISDITSNLVKCPFSSNLIEECGQAIPNEQILAYDLGTNVFKVAGKITTFSSHDNAKVTVDNTRFFQSSEKCTFNITCDKNTITLHSDKALLTDPYVVMLRLKDKSRITFFLKKDKSKELTENEEEIGNIIYDSPKVGDDLPKVDEDQDEDIPKCDEDISEDAPESQLNVQQVVHCVDEEYIKEVLEGKSLEDLSTNDNYEDLMNSLINARNNNGIIYKVNTKSNYLKRRNSNLKVPLEIALRNVILFDNVGHTQSPKSYQMYTKRFESQRDNKIDLDIRSVIDFRICLPNGLFIRPHACMVYKNKIIIKQEYIQEKPNVSTMQHEEFRLFSNLGLVLIKKIDGTITILNANGDIIDLEKPSDGSEVYNSVNPCHCSTFADYRKKINKLLKDQENCDFTTSRRGHITSKQNHILDTKFLNILEQFNVPYNKKSVTKFDGKRIKIQGDKITQKQLYHITSQEDYFTGDNFFERNDDFRSVVEKSGSQKNIFPDGTVISTVIDMTDELVGDFVYVRLSYQYEHPYYATVKYDFDKRTSISLNNHVNIEENEHGAGFIVKMEEGLSVSVAKEKVCIEKNCAECNEKFEAAFNINPFRMGHWNPYDEFMHVSDSYGKHFYSDFVGNCSRNNDFIKGATNLKKCDHVVKTKYKKLFIVNRNLTGEILYTNDNVKRKMNEMEAHPYAEVNSYKSISNENISVVDCRKKFYTPFYDRFYNNSIYLPDYFTLKSNPKCECYTTFNIFYKMFPSVDEIASHVCQLKKVFFNDFSGESIICKHISTLTNALELYYAKYQNELIEDERELIEKKGRQSEELRKRNLKCVCTRERLTMQEKISKWKKACDIYRQKMKSTIPGYFKSDFFKAVE